MDIGLIEILFGVLVVLAAAWTAVLATRLKIRNKELEDTVAELHARLKEDQRLWSEERMKAAAQMIAMQPVSSEPVVTVAAPLAAEPVAAEPASELATDRDRQTTKDDRLPHLPHLPQLPHIPEADRSVAMRRAEERAMDFASRQGRRRHPSPSPESLPKVDETNSKEALSEWLNKRAAARASRRTAPAPQPTVQPDPEPEASVPEPSDESEVAHDEVLAEPSPEPEEVVEPLPTVEPAKPMVFIDESLWESIVGPAPTRFEVIHGADLPAGWHDDVVLSRLLESNKPFHGLAVAIGVSLSDGSDLSQDVMLGVEHLVRGMLEDGDFSCQTGDDEILLLCPGKHGGEAEQRLSGISERLWDFQLRGAGTFAIQFSTAQVEVEDERMREVVAAASTSLQQTRRARKMMSVEFGSNRKTASAAG